MKRHLHLPALVALLLSAACSSPGSGSGAAGSASGSPGANTAAAAEDDNVPEDPSIKLVEKGAAPRSKLRYQITEGAEEIVVLVQTRSEAMVGEKPRTVPPSKLTVALTPKAAAGSDREWSYQIKAATVDETGPLAAALQQGMQKLIGLKGTIVAGDRGNVRKVEPSIPAGADPVTTQLATGLGDSLQAVFVPLPAGSVGAGAKWEHTYEAKQMGITVKTVSRYEVVSISGDEVKLKVSQTQEAGKQTLELAPGQKVDVSGYKADGSGELTLLTKHLTPRAGKTETKGAMTMEGLGKAAKEVKLTTTLEITGR